MTGVRMWTIGAVLLIAAILGLGWVVGVSPMLAQAAGSDAERESVELTNAAQAALLAQMKKQYDDLDALREELADLRESIPGTVDTDVVYTLLAGYRTASGAAPSLITLGEAVQYGIPATQETTTASPAPASGAAPTGTLATDLYTVSVTISFSAAPLDQVLAFVAAMQHGPRLFLVTSVIANPDNSSITAYMFVISDGATSQFVPPPTPEVEVPAPEATETPGPTESPTPTPAP